MAEEDLKKLPPEERIKRLKEMEKKKKQEIEEGQKVIKDSEEEITGRRKWLDKVPVPEVAKEDLEGLSDEGKVLVQLHKSLKKSEEKVEAERKELSPHKAVSELEETVGREAISTSRGGNVNYDLPGRNIGLSYEAQPRSMVEISKELKDIYQRAMERGYVTLEEGRQVGKNLYDVEKKLEAVEEGKYKEFSEQVAEAASLSQSIGSKLHDMYKNKGGSNRQYNSGY